MRSRRRWLFAAVLTAALVLPAKAGALGLQSIGVFDQPIFVTSDPADPDRIFVVERGGLIKLIDHGSTRTFADLTPVVRCCEIERGLLSMAFAPDFPQTGLLYVFYTGNDGPGNLHVSELKASGDTTSVGTLRGVLTIDHSQAGNHNGGQLQFGSDGYLYVSTGDGGSTPATAQDRNSLLGKVLRIEPRQDGSSPYSVPSGNPFVGGPGADEVWAYGLRNPWRFSFDRATGDLLLADVGQNSYEEVDYAPLSAGLGRGANFAWSACEGFHAYPGGTPCLLPGRTDPIFEYSQAGGGCSITGGYVVRDPTLGDLAGRYLYSDYCLGQIRSLVPALPAAAADRYEGITVSQPVSFGQDACGRLYVAERAVNVFRFTGSSTPVCSVLTVSKRGRGVITGQGIDCPPDCVEVFPQPKSVVLKALPRRRANFSGWRRACSGKGRCTVSMSTDRRVLARFRGPLRTRVRLIAADSSLPDRARASLRVKVSPCKGRRHDAVILFRDGKRIDGKQLNRNCVARFHPRVGNGASFVARVSADRRHRAGKSAAVDVVARR